MSVEESVKKQLDEARGTLEAMRKAAASMPAEAAAPLMASLKEQEAKLQNGELAKMLTATLQAERAEKSGNAAADTKAASARYPADPAAMFERRLREFLDATANVNFAARTLSLIGGPDGIEFLDPPDREKPILWQQAVIVGPEATAAARAAAGAWLKEIFTMRPMTRRQALAAVMALPLGARVVGQTQPTRSGPRHRVIPGRFTHSLLLEPDGTLKTWAGATRAILGHLMRWASDATGPIADFTLVAVPGLSNVVATAVGTGFSFAVLGDGRLLAWGQNANGMLGTTPLSHLEP